MADYTKVNGVAAASIVKVNSVTATSIAKINGATKPSSGATRLVACFDDAYVSYVDVADEDDVTAWEDNMYQTRTGDSWDITDIAFGKDGSGDPFYVAVVNSNNPEIIHDDDADITDGSQWTEVNLGTGGISGNLKQRTVLWGNDVWISIGKHSASAQYLYRSTDGSTWSAVDLSGLNSGSGIAYSNEVTGLTSDGAGKWWFGCGGVLYISTDDGSSWAASVTFSGEIIQDLAYTNDTLVALVKHGGNPHLRAAASSDTTDFSSKVQLEDSNSDGLSGNNAKRMAAGAGRVVVIDTARSLAADVDGKTVTIVGTRQDMPDEGNLNCICTDGTGNFWAGSDGGSTGADGGDICKSDDNGASWTKIAEGINKSGDRKVEGITTNVTLPV